MKIRPVGAELFLADRRTDMTKLIVTFHNSANAPKTLIAVVFTVHLPTAWFLHRSASVKTQRKYHPVTCMKTQRGSRGTAILFL